MRWMKTPDRIVYRLLQVADHTLRMLEISKNETYYELLLEKEASNTKEVVLQACSEDPIDPCCKWSTASQPDMLFSENVHSLATEERLGVYCCSLEDPLTV